MRRTVKRGVIILAVLLPGLCLVLSITGEILIRSIPEPRWTVSAAEAGIARAWGRCSQAGELEKYHAQAVEDTPGEIISARIAGQVASQVIGRHRPAVFALYAYGPHLTRLTLPDGQERLAWYQVVVTNDGGSTLMGKADVVYVDAKTAHPLLRITDVGVGDPSFACGTGFLWLGARQWATRAGIGLSTLCLAPLALVGGVRLLRRRARQSEKTPGTAT